MPATLAEVIARLRRDHASLGIRLYAPASEAELRAFERQKGVRLPPDMRELYRFCNGFESAEDLFRIIPLREIAEHTPDSYLTAPQDFHFAEYLSYCDMWTMSVEPQETSAHTIYNTAHDTVTLTHSLAEFPEVFLQHGVFGDGGLYDWRQPPEKQALFSSLSLSAPSPMHELDQLAEQTRQQLNLRYDAESVKYLEGFIERTKGSLPPEQWPGLVNSLGAFLGRCIIVNYGGQWQHHAELGTGVAFDAKNQIFPFNKTSKQFNNGLGDSVYSFYTLIPAIYNRPVVEPTPTPPPVRRPWYKFW